MAIAFFMMALALGLALVGRRSAAIGSIVLGLAVGVAVFLFHFTDPLNIDL